MSFKLSSGVAAPLILTSLTFFSLHCSSDDGSPDGGAGAPATAGTGGSAPTAGAPTAGSPSGGSGGSGGGAGGSVGGGGSSAGSGGSSAGSGGSSGGVGGSGGSGGSGGDAGGAGGTAGSGGSGGAGGAGGAGGSGGGNGATFEPVKQLLAMSCAGGMCHSAASSQLDLVTSDGLHGRLTSAIPNDIPHCAGDKPIVAMDQNSLLLRLVKGQTMCTKSGGGMETIARMPDHCGEQGRPPCLTEAQIKLISDWIAAGAPL